MANKKIFQIKDYLVIRDNKLSSESYSLTKNKNAVATIYKDEKYNIKSNKFEKGYRIIFPLELNIKTSFKKTLKCSIKFAISKRDKKIVFGQDKLKILNIL